MSNAHHRPKQPDATKQQLVSVATRLAIEQGVAGLTLDAVIRGAGISKGGLQHHFPTKASLLEELVNGLIDAIVVEIEAETERDPVPQGAAARAYLRVVADMGDRPPEMQHWRALTIACYVEPALWQRWRDASDRLRALDFADGSDPEEGLAVRLIAEGLWASDMFDLYGITPDQRRSLLARYAPGRTKVAGARKRGAKPGA
jgi:AcrR family transcriptional regulator